MHPPYWTETYLALSRQYASDVIQRGAVERGYRFTLQHGYPDEDDCPYKREDLRNLFFEGASARYQY
jgi:hypothetical protein